MRILKGRYAGRHLTSPGARVRPSSEATRERAIGLVEKELPGARVLDLFAGSGALGLEALSRGAADVTFVEKDPAALHALKANIAALRVRDRSRIFKRDVLPWVEGLEAAAFGVAFADPPYHSRKLDLLVQRWLEAPFAGTLVIEHAKDHPIEAPGKRFDLEGSTRLTLLRVR